MAVGEHVGLDANPLAERALARKPAAFDLRRNRLDDHPAAPVGTGLGGEGALERRAGEPPLDRSASHETNRNDLGSGRAPSLAGQGGVEPLLVAGRIAYGVPLTDR